MSDPAKIAGAFKEVAKLKDSLGYITWEREMTERLELTRLISWVTTVTTLPTQTDSLQGEALEKAKAVYEDGHSVTCAVIKMRTEGTNWHAIKNIKNAKDMWDTLRSKNQPKGSGYLTGALRRFSSLTLSQCSDPNEYCNQFQDRFNELQNFQGTVVIDDNVLIWMFHEGLGPDYKAYVNKYNDEHEPFLSTTTNSVTTITPKHTLSHAVDRFLQFKASDGSSTSNSMALVATTTADSRFRDDIRPNNTTPIRVPAQWGIRQGHCVEVIQKKKFCGVPGCRSPYGHDDTTHSDNPGKRRNDDNTGGDQKRRRRGGGGGGGNNNNKDNSKPKDEEYKAPSSGVKPSANLAFIPGVEPALAYVAVAAPPAIQRDYEACLATNLSSATTYIFDTGCTNHIVGDSRVFTRRELLPEPIHIGGFSGGRSATHIGSISLPCQGDHGIVNLKIHDVYFVPGNTYNLISPGQMQRAGCQLQWRNDTDNLGISLGRNGIFARLSPGDLYLLDVDAASINGLSLALYTITVNPKALKYWYEVTGYIGE